MRETLIQLRQVMEQKHVDIVLIPSSDFHGSEYIGDYFKARAWMSGFTGSAGTLVVTRDQAGLWTDGRYFIQAERQLAGSGITLYKMGAGRRDRLPAVHRAGNAAGRLSGLRWTDGQRGAGQPAGSDAGKEAGADFKHGGSCGFDLEGPAGLIGSEGGLVRRTLQRPGDGAEAG